MEMSLHDIYRKGMGAYQSGDYDDAADVFDEVERQYPYSQWAAKAQLMAAYCLYKDRDFEHAIQSIDRFIMFHPTHPLVPYAYYLRGLCYYRDIASVQRCEHSAQLAFQAFDDVAKRFPATSYAKDAAKKRDFIVQHMANKEMIVGRYYLEQGHTLAAMKRFFYVISYYQNTPNVEEALFRMAEIQWIWGLDGQVQRTCAILKHNYPKSPWYPRAQELLEKK